MTFKEARDLRDEIRAAGIHCTVPTGWGPAAYFVKTRCGHFVDRQHWLRWRDREKPKD